MILDGSIRVVTSLYPGAVNDTEVCIRKLLWSQKTETGRKD